MKNAITKLFAGAALLGLVIAGCSSLKEESGVVEKKSINFSATIGSYQVKATDTAFETGDVIGLYADYPVAAQNARLIWQDGGLVPETPVYWGSGQLVDQSVEFYAYYPFDAAISDPFNVLFTVREDQTTHEGYTASDLMIANTYSAPAEGTVNLNFTHRMSKLVLRIDNRLEGETVAAVSVGNVYLSATGSLKVSKGLRAAGEPGTVKAGKISLAGGETAWTAIIAPDQYTMPAIVVTMESGKDYVYQVDYDIWFDSCRCYNAQVVIDETSISTDFTSNITDWYDGGWFWFGQNVPSPYDGAWSIIGTVLGTYWDTDIWMEYWGDVWYYRLAYRAGQEFKFRMNGDWAVNYGGVEANMPDWQTMLLVGEANALAEGGPNLMLPEDGYYDVYLNTGDQTVTVYYSGELEPVEITLDQIQPIVDAENETYVEFTQVVYAVSTRGFVLYDGKYSIFVYTGAGATIPEIGDIVRVSGTKTIYNNVPEISGPSYEVLGQADEMYDIYFDDVTSYLDNGFADIAMPISIDGVLSSDGYTLTVEGQSFNASLFYPVEYLYTQAYKGYTLRVYGFYNGRSDDRGLVYIIPVYYEVIAEPSDDNPDGPDIPDNAILVTWGAEALAAAPGGNEVVMLDNIASFTNSSNYTGTVTELRIYKNQTFAVSVPEGYELVSILLTCSSSYGPAGFGAGAPEGYFYEDLAGAWAGSAAEVSFTATDKQVRVTELTVAYVPVQ